MQIPDILPDFCVIIDIPLTDEVMQKKYGSCYRMEFYELGAGIWGSVFAVPTDIVDRYLKFAGSASLKVLLWLLRNNSQKSNISAQDIASALHMNTVDVKDAMEFWYEMGVVKKTMSNPEKTVPETIPPKPTIVQQPLSADTLATAQPNISQTNTEPLTEKTETINNGNNTNSSSKSVTKVMPTTAEIVNRKQIDKNFSDLLDEAEKMLARPLTHSDASILLLMHDYDGLPYEVIKMILFFANEQKKMKMRYIETLGHDWGTEEIYTIEQAEEKITNILNSYKEWKRIAPFFGLNAAGEVSDIQAEYADCWVKQWGYSDDMLRAAYETCISSKGIFHLKYLHGILRKWHNEGIMTEKDLADRLKNFDDTSKPESKKAKNIKPSNHTDDSNSSASYDIHFLDGIGLLD